MSPRGNRDVSAGRTDSVRVAAIVAALAASSTLAEARPLDTVTVVNGRLTGVANGQMLDARDLIGNSFEDGALTYSIVDAASDPFVPGLWRYRITWRAEGSRDWSAMCRNSRGSTGWAYVMAGDGGPHFLCEDSDMAVCFAKANGLSLQRAISLCLGN